MIHSPRLVVKSWMLVMLSLPAFAQMLGPPISITPATSSPRQRIQSCYQMGAINTPMMQACSGLFVSTQDFLSCMNYGPCFGEPATQMASNPGPAFCGSIGLPYCPASKPCGYAETISCQFAPQCGAPPYPACVMPQPCGFAGNLVCPPPAPSSQTPYAFDTFRPSFLVNIPRQGIPNQASPSGWIQFASPPIPDLIQARHCRASSANRDQFDQCLVSSALPQEYRLTQDCLTRNQGDPTGAYVCSTGNGALATNYQRLKQVKACANKGSDGQIALCLGTNFLGPNERYYLNCIQNNKNDTAALAVCALAPWLNPEQQIAVSCAITTGGQPHAFATCTAGRLTARELQKCWQYGIATDQGCFGPNNELRKFSQQIDDQARRAFGQNSVAYQAFSFWQNNIVMPGPNHEFVKFLNNGLNDIQHGPGPNNEIVKFGNQVSEGLQSIGRTVQCLFGC